MASIKFGSIGISDARGSIGGTVFSRNRGGAYIRQRTTPVNPNTSRQAAIRATFGTVQSSWRGLTEAQRESWRSNAVNFPVKNRLGETITLQGNILFQKCNMVLASAGLPLSVICSTNPAQMSTLTPVPFPGDEWTYSEALGVFQKCYVNFTFKDTLQTGDVINFYASAPGSAGRQATSSAPLRLLASVPYADWHVDVMGESIRIDLSNVYNAAYVLGPSVYTTDSSITVRGEIFNAGQGFAMPMGVWNILSKFNPIP